MKKIRKCLLTLGMVVCGGLACLSTAACGNTAKYVFQTNGGAAIETVEVEAGTSYTLPTPQREGYAFGGWYTNADFSGEPVTTVVAGEDQTYYAKWEKQYAITLALDGGTLVQSKLYLTEGANVYEYMQEYKPTKEGLVFGAWFNGETELASGMKMPAAELTLTAKYKVQYTVELWTEKLDGSGYEKAEENVVDYAYVGTNFTSEQKLTGFTENKTHTSAVTSKTLSQVASENVFKHYFDRISYNVSFHSNYPDGSGEATAPVSVAYGQYVTVPSDYEFEGYCLIGWATSATGEVIYKSNYLESRLYGGDKTTKADEFTPERHTTLFAVWAKGYVDIFGGDDYVYLLAEDAKEIYISRGNVFFQAEYKSKNKEFDLLDDSDSVILSGKLLGEGTYAYYNAVRSEAANSLYQVGTGLVETTKIYFDEYNGIQYVDTKAAKTSNGTYYIDEGGYYIATFTDGELANKTLTILTGTVTADDGTEQPAFQLRNEDEVALGSLTRYFVNGFQLSAANVYQLTLNGWGTATYNTGSGNATFSYTMDAETQTITLNNSRGALEAVLKVIEVGGKKGYMLYEEKLEKSLTLSGGATLELDGVSAATYTSGTKILEGYYTAKESAFGGFVISFTATTNESHTFLIKITTPEDPDETDDVVPEDIYTIEKKPNGYAEYYYQNDNSTYYAPLLVINDTPAKDSATLYGYTSEREYVKVSEGTFVFNDTTKLYTYTADPDKTVTGTAAATTPVDIEKIEWFTCAIDDANTEFAINYWYTVKETGKDAQTLNVEYTAKKAGSNATLTIVAGLAIYKADGSVVTGTYTTSEDGITTISPRYGNKVYLEIDETEKKFEVLAHAPYNAYQMGADGKKNEKVYIAFDGKGGATYTVEKDGDDEVYAGTYEELEKTSTGKDETVYQFTATGKTFEFLLINKTFYPYNESYNGQYRAADGARLTLDGYGYWATYTTTNGDNYSGYYNVANAIVGLNVGGEYRYFDIKDEGFSVRGLEYGKYEVLDNQAKRGLWVEFDGKSGKLSVSNEDGYITQNGTYTVNGKVFVLSYTAGSETVTLTGECAEIGLSAEETGIFTVSHKEVVQTFVYVNAARELLNVLILDDVGNAVMYDEAGVKNEGKYTIITNTMLYYERNDGLDGCIYIYDKAAGTAEPIQFTARGYFTKDLESLLFSKYGFAVFNGGDRYYYNVVNNEVVIYRQDATDAKANEYGFVADTSFGRIDQTQKVYGGKTYYANNGLSISFARKEGTETQYPILDDTYLAGAMSTLSFAPSGDGEFSVIGQANIGTATKPFSCKVVRTSESGALETYVDVGGATGVYRFYITVDYKGGENDNTYQITGMRWIRTALSYNYLSVYYNYYYFYGSAAANTYENDFGELSVNREYNAAGEETDCYVTAEFGELSEMYDTNGNVVSFERATYSEESDSYPYAEFTAEDGCVYRLYFLIARHPAFVNTEGYRVYALTRQDKPTVAEGGYSLTVERVITSEANIAAGRIFSVELKDANGEIAYDYVFFKGNTVSYVSRTKNDDGIITATTYYMIELTEESDAIGGEEDKEKVNKYVSATVTAETVNTYYNEDETSYVDVSATRGVVFMSIDGKIVLVNESTDNGNSTYTVASSDGNTYTVKIEGGKAVITQA